MKIFVSFLIACILLAAETTHSQTVYVTQTGAGSKNGTSWSDAYSATDFRSVLRTASSGTSFWIAAGTYYAGTNKDSSWRVPNGVKLYGGFPSSGTPILEDRDWNIYPTIFNGDLNNDDYPNLNGEQLVSHFSRLDNTNTIFILTDADSSTVLDGLTIVNGNAIVSNGFRTRGGGVFATGNTTAIIRNCLFTLNSANVSGGAVAITNTTSINESYFINCSFRKNFANNGGGVYSEGKTYFKQCLLDSNSTRVTGGFGGATYLIDSSVFDSCVITNNSSNPRYGGCHNKYGIYTHCTFSGNNLYLLYNTRLITCSLTSSNIIFNGIIGEDTLFIDSSMFSLSDISFDGNYPAIIATNSTFSSGSDLNALYCGMFFLSKCSYLYSSVTIIGGSIIDSCNFIGSTINLRGSGNKCTITNNSFYGGGAINCINPIGLLIDNCHFENCKLYRNGGAIYIDRNDGFNGGFPTISHCVFKNNSTEGYGGAIYSNWHNIIISDCVFENNKAARGGALYINGGYSLTNSILVGNSAKGIGGAIYSSIYSYTPYSNPPYLGSSINCTFWNNDADTSAGAIYVERKNVMRTYNTIYWDNYSKQKDSISNIISLSPATVKNCVFQPQPVYTISDTLTMVNTVTDYPAFTDTSSLRGADTLWMTNDDGLAVLSCSPSVNSGDNNLAPTLVTDIAGNTRVFDSIIDIGAYENQSSKTTSLLASVSITVSDSTPCRRDLVEFVATPQHAGNIPTYKWWKNRSVYAVTTDSILVIPANVLTSGDSISCELITSETCAYPTSALSNAIPVYPISLSNPIINGSSTALVNTTVLYFVNDVNGSGYAWMAEGGNIVFDNGKDSIEVEWQNIGLGKVKVVESAITGCISDIITLNIVVEDTTLALSADTLSYTSAGASKQVIVYSNSAWVAYTAESWITIDQLSGIRQDTLSITVSSNTGGADRAGWVFFAAGTLTDSVFVTQNGTTGLNTLSNAYAVLVYPNPASENMYVDFGALDATTKTIKLYTAAGKLIYETQLSDKLLHMNMKEYAPGIYLMHIIADNRVINIRIIKH